MLHSTKHKKQIWKFCFSALSPSHVIYVYIKSVSVLSVLYITPGSSLMNSGPSPFYSPVCHPPGEVLPKHSELQFQAFEAGLSKMTIQHTSWSADLEYPKK